MSPDPPTITFDLVHVELSLRELGQYIAHGLIDLISSGFCALVPFC